MFTIKKVIAAIVFSLSMGSLVWYAFTGVPYWAPLGGDDVIRAMLLTFIHIAGIVFPLIVFRGKF